MKTSRALRILATLVACAGFGVGSARAEGDIGKKDFEARCAACHGWLGTGDGSHLSMTPEKRERADLTLLARRNNGVFPMLLVTEIIDGRVVSDTHGAGVMPVWGDIYRQEARERGVAPEYVEGEVQRRIWALAEYLYRLQK